MSVLSHFLLQQQYGTKNSQCTIKAATQQKCLIVVPRAFGEVRRVLYCTNRPKIRSVWGQANA